MEEMLYGKWLDPLLALTAIYEIVRRGDVTVAQQLLKSKKKAAALTGIPLLRESLLRAPQLMEKLPLPAGLLDYGSIWTSWLGAVKSPVWKTK